MHMKFEWVNYVWAKKLTFLSILIDEESLGKAGSKKRRRKLTPVFPSLPSKTKSLNNRSKGQSNFSSRYFSNIFCLLIFFEMYICCGKNRKGIGKKDTGLLIFLTGYKFEHPPQKINWGMFKNWVEMWAGLWLNILTFSLSLSLSVCLSVSSKYGRQNNYYCVFLQHWLLRLRGCSRLSK